MKSSPPEQAALAGAVMPPALLLPFRKSLARKLHPRDRFPWRVAAGLLFAATLVCALYLGTFHLVSYFHRQSELGIILSLKIFQMAWIILFAMLLFSCMVSAVSDFFLSQDNDIIFAAPVDCGLIFRMRLTSNTAYTSWMMLLFSLPVFAAYGTAFEAGPLYWPLLLCSLAALVATANTAGALATIILVNLFPARRTRDIIIYLSLCFGIFLYLIFRFIRPEDLVNPDRFGNFIEYLSAISTPAGPFLPPAWVSSLLALQLTERRNDLLLFSLTLTTPAALYVLGEWAMNRWFPRGYSKACEAFGGQRRFRPLKYSKNMVINIWRRETRGILRDSNEWAQFFLIAALMVVYLYNFHLLPMDRTFINRNFLAMIIGFLNIGLAGFMTASLAARFIFPSVGAEGGSFYHLQSAPISLGRYLAIKYTVYALPLLLINLAMIIGANHIIGLPPGPSALTLAASTLMTMVISALALACGTLYADFRVENRAAALGGFGAVVFIFTAIFLILVFTGATFFPFRRLAAMSLASTPVTARDIVFAAGFLLPPTLLGTIIVRVIFSRAIKALEEKG